MLSKICCWFLSAGSFCDWILVPQKPELLIVEDALQDVR